MNKVKQEIIKEAFYSGKVSKAIMSMRFEAILNYYTKGAEELADIPAQVIDFLIYGYNYFQVPTPKKAKTWQDFYKKVKPSNNIRPFLNFIFVDDYYIVVADGHRLISKRNAEGFYPGFYNENMIKLFNLDEYNYPDYLEIIERVKNHSIYKIDFSANEFNIEGDFITFNISDNFNLKFTKNFIFDFIGDKKHFYICADAERPFNSVRIINPDFDDLTMILMPIK